MHEVGRIHGRCPGKKTVAVILSVELSTQAADSQHVQRGWQIGFKYIIFQQIPKGLFGPPPHPILLRPSPRLSIRL